MSSSGSLDLFDVFVAACVVTVIALIVGAMWHYNINESKNRNATTRARVEACNVPGSDPTEIANCVLLLEADG